MFQHFENVPGFRHVPCAACVMLYWKILRRLPYFRLVVGLGVADFTETSSPGRGLLKGYMIYALRGVLEMWFSQRSIAVVCKAEPGQ